MRDEDFVEFLKWALPRVDKRWSGFRKPRGQVKKRVQSRMDELGLESLEDYRRWLEEHPAEWDRFDQMARVTISEFYRNRGTWDFLRDEVLGELVVDAERDGRDRLRAWSAGCASGEEPHTLRILWEIEYADSPVRLEIVASDVDPHMIDRARAARYPRSSVRDLPDEWVDEAFELDEDEVVLREEFRDVEFRVEDVTDSMPDGPFDLVFCAYTVFIYYEEQIAREFLHRLADRVVDGAALVVGGHEAPPEVAGLRPADSENVYRFGD